MSTLVQTVQILWNPVDAVPQAVARRRWVWPLVLLMFAGGFATVALTLRWDPASSVLADLASSGKLQNTSEADLTEAVTTAGRVQLIKGLAFALLGIPMLVLVGAATVKFVTWLLGRKALFAGIFSALCVALSPLVVAKLLLALLTLWQLDVTPEKAQALMPSNLALVFKPHSHKLSTVLATVDFFGLWSAALLGLGLSEVMQMSRGRALLFALALYVAYAALVVVGLPGMSGGHL